MIEYACPKPRLVAAQPTADFQDASSTTPVSTVRSQMPCSRRCDTLKANYTSRVVEGMQKRVLFALSLVLVASAGKSFAVCHAVGPAASGNGSGSDWSDVMKLPTAPVRGDTYYLMDGSYGSYSPTTATSGTTRITVKKAQSYDYGRISDGCPNDISAGWNAATMGNSQAIFSGVGQAFSTSGGQGYYTLDGNGKTTTAGCGLSPAVNAAASDCGIKLLASGTSATTYGVLWINSTYDTGVTRATGWTVRYLEIVGAGDAEINVTNGNEHTLYCRNGCNNFLFEHNYLHDCGTDCIDTPYGSNVTFNLNHFRHNPIPTAANHGQFWLADGNQNDGYVWSNNLIQDMVGTAYWAVLNGGQASNWQIYNNVIFQTDPTRHVDTGTFVVINPGSNGQNINIIGNTWANDHSTYSGHFTFACDSTDGAVCNGTITFENNLLYDIVDDQDGTRPVGSSQFPNTIANHNSYINVPGSIGLLGIEDVVIASGASSPFLNWSDDNFNLTGESASVNNGLALAAPYNVDAAGNMRPGGDGVWDRGAFQYDGSKLQAPSPPTGLMGTPK